MLKTIVSCKSFECLAVVVGPIIGSYYLWDSLFTEDLFMILITVALTSWYRPHKWVFGVIVSDY